VSRRFSTTLPLLALGFVALAVMFAGFIGPRDAAEQNRSFPFAPPTRLHLIDTAGNFHLRPFVYAISRTAGENEYSEDRSRLYRVRLIVPGAPYKLAGLIRTRIHLAGVEGDAKLFLLGTDGYGRDQFSRLLEGGQISLSAGLLATTLSLLAGLIVGIVSGFYGGRIDALLMRTSELFFALPWLYLLLAVRAVLPLHLEPRMAFLLVVGIVGVVGWARPARLVRGIVLSIKERNYVLAARGFGATDWYVIHRHLLPETAGVLLTQAAILLPRYVLAEVTLSFLGLGVSEPVASWGNMLGALQRYYVLVSYWWMLAPALVLIPLFLACQRLAEALQSRLQPAA
jgi:peptide/nickel transport system permease protein